MMKIKGILNIILTFCIFYEGYGSGKDGIFFYFANTILFENISIIFCIIATISIIMLILPFFEKIEIEFLKYLSSKYKNEFISSDWGNVLIYNELDLIISKNYLFKRNNKEERLSIYLYDKTTNSFIKKYRFSNHEQYKNKTDIMPKINNIVGRCFDANNVLYEDRLKNCSTTQKWVDKVYKLYGKSKGGYKTKSAIKQIRMKSKLYYAARLIVKENKKDINIGVIIFENLYDKNKFHKYILDYYFKWKLVRKIKKIFNRYYLYIKIEDVSSLEGE